MAHTFKPVRYEALTSLVAAKMMVFHLAKMRHFETARPASDFCVPKTFFGSDVGCGTGSLIAGTSESGCMASTSSIHDNKEAN